MLKKIDKLAVHLVQLGQHNALIFASIIIIFVAINIIWVCAVARLNTYKAQQISMCTYTRDDLKFKTPG